MSDAKLLICPYCGQAQPTADRCRACGGLFEPLSRQATHNAMGPWFVRDTHRPFQPGCSYDTLVKLIQRGQLTRHTIVRGPTTRQFWTIAARVPGISHYFGACYQCDASVDSSDNACHACGATFGALLDRNFLGLPEHRPLPWEEGALDAPSQRMEYDEPADLPHTPPPAGEPRGLSSFATDEELFGRETNEHDATPPSPSDAVQSASTGDTDSSGSSTNGERQTGATMTSPDPLPMTTVKEAPDLEDDVDPAAQSLSASPSPQPHAASPSSDSDSPYPVAMPASQTRTVPYEDPVSAAQVRSLQRRLSQQQRSRQRLTVIALVATAVAVVALIAWWGGGERNTAQPIGATEAIEEDERSTDDGVSRSVSSDAEQEDGLSTSGRDPILDALAEDASQHAKPPAEEPQPDEGAERAEDDPWNAERVERLLSDAQERLDRAQDDGHALEQRLRDVEGALEKLQTLREAPEDLHPENLDRLIDEANRERERLKLREFFP